MLHKIGNVLALTADLAPGALAIIGGMAVMIAGATGTLWH
jgi:hypothetical protein